MSQIDRLPRSSPNEQTVVRLHTERESYKEGWIQDVSQSGAFLWNCCIPEKTSKVDILIKDKKPIGRNCRIARKNQEKNWAAIQFDEQLSNFEFSRTIGIDSPLYLPGDTSTYDLAKIDRTEVFRQANQIKICSSNYFIWVMGLILPMTLGIWTLTIEGTLNATSTSSAMIVILALFCVGAFSNLEKARAINRRESFIAALDYYLSRQQGPLGYRGWANLKHCFSECGTRRRAKLCPLLIHANDTKTCRDNGENKASIMRHSKRILPSLLDSFLSLTSFFYALIFLALVILTVMSLSNTWYMFSQTPKINTSLWFIAGFLAGFIIMRIKYLLVVILSVVVLFLIAGVIFTSHSLLNFISSGIGIILGFIAWSCLRQLIALRVGHYSFETLVHMWFEIFENCIFLPDDASKGELPESRRKNLLKKFFSYIS